MRLPDPAGRPTGVDRRAARSALREVLNPVDVERLLDARYPLMTSGTLGWLAHEARVPQRLAEVSAALALIGRYPDGARSWQILGIVRDLPLDPPLTLFEMAALHGVLQRHAAASAIDLLATGGQAMDALLWANDATVTGLTAIGLRLVVAPAVWGGAATELRRNET